MTEAPPPVSPALTLTREVAIAAEIALAAAELVRSFVGVRLRVDSKAGDEPVTDADRAANSFIVERLARAFPEDALLSEELPDDGSRHGATRVWMVDPIDGTSDFILGDTGYAVMIGLCIDGRPAMGVVSQPSTGTTYSGVVGQGAWMRSGTGETVALATTTLRGPPGIRLVASKSHRTPRVDAIRRALHIEDEINIASVGLKMGLVANATRDLYIYTGGRTKIWDTCGPEAILVAAGGRVTDVDGCPLRYDGGDLYNRRGIVASNGPLHDAVVAALASVMGSNSID